MRNRFDEQLDNLNNSLISMGALCETAIASTIKAMTSGDKTLAEEVIKTDREIDHKEKEIESLCLKLLLQQQPVARDLRLVSAALKMITDMERIGDQAQISRDNNRCRSFGIDKRRAYNRNGQGGDQNGHRCRRSVCASRCGQRQSGHRI